MRNLVQIASVLLHAIFGGFSNPSKMPCASWSISAEHCKTGRKLAMVPGSVCSKCYAFRNGKPNGCYGFKSTVVAMDRRFDTLQRALADPIARGEWIGAMVAAIGRKRSDVFRWHDSGDIQSVTHLSMLCEIAAQLPNVRFWLPTKERGMVTAYLASGATIPANLCVRLSMQMIDQPAPTKDPLEASGVRFSTVYTEKPKGTACPAPNQNGACMDCRNCWSRKVRVVSYLEH